MKPQDQLAAGIAFGVELETYIPSGAGITVGAYHRGDPVRSGPSFEGQFWRADRDSSIRAAAGCRPCEFVSPILHGEAGLACLRQFVRFAKETVGANVNLSCGCHITVGIQSVIGSADVRATAQFLRALARFANQHSWAIYAQTGTDRHHTRYAAPLPKETGQLTNDMLRASDTTNATELADDCGRGIVNFKKAFMGDRGAVEFRAFAGTLSEPKIMHHLATVLGLVRRAATAKVTPLFSRPGPRPANAPDALKALWATLGWSGDTLGVDRALGLYGDLYSDFDRHSKAALRMAERFERRYPQAPDTYPDPPTA